MLDYPVILEAQPEGGFVVTFPDVPEAITRGEDEALLYAVDALETALSFYVDDRKPLPVPSKAISRHSGFFSKPATRRAVALHRGHSIGRPTLAP